MTPPPRPGDRMRAAIDRLLERIDGTLEEAGYPTARTLLGSVEAVDVGQLRPEDFRSELADR